MVLGGYSFGFFATQLIGGFMAERFGGKWVFGCAILMCSILNFILPTMTMYFGFPAIMIIRVIQGFVQGPMNPAQISLSSMWLPAPEKNRMMSFIFSGEAHPLQNVTKLYF